MKFDTFFHSINQDTGVVSSALLHYTYKKWHFRRADHQVLYGSNKDELNILIAIIYNLEISANKTTIVVFHAKQPDINKIYEIVSVTLQLT